MRHLFKLLFLVLTLPVFSHMGQQKHTIIDEKRSRPIEMMVWYPTKSDKLTNEGTVWIQPNVAIDAPIEGEEHPLILLSHGWGGEKIELVWLAEKLVEKGYIVVGIDHYGNTWKDYSEEISADYWHRPMDISQTIDYLIQDSPFATSVDQGRIGFAGFSMGGLTGLWLSGGEINQASYKDPRIRAFFLMAPRGKDFSGSSIESISAPLFIISGEEDKILSYEEHGGYINDFAPQCHFELLKGEIGHPIFINCPSELGKKNLAKEITEDSPSVDRREIHNEVAKIAIQFFSDNL